MLFGLVKTKRERDSDLFLTALLKTQSLIFVNCRNMKNLSGLRDDCET